MSRSSHCTTTDTRLFQNITSYTHTRMQQSQQSVQAKSFMETSSLLMLCLFGILLLPSLSLSSPPRSSSLHILIFSYCHSLILVDKKWLQGVAKKNYMSDQESSPLAFCLNFISIGRGSSRIKQLTHCKINVLSPSAFDAMGWSLWGMVSPKEAQRGGLGITTWTPGHPSYILRHLVIRLCHKSFLADTG